MSRLASTPGMSARQELRIPMEKFVHLHSSDNSAFEVTSTIDIRSHGVRVVTKRSWRPESKNFGSINVRRSLLACPCRSLSTLYGQFLVIGIELSYPTDN